MKGLVAGSKGGLMGALGAMGKQKTVRHSITRHAVTRILRVDHA